MRKIYKERQKNNKWTRRAGQLTPQERALAIAWVPPTFEFDEKWRMIMGLRGSGTSVPAYLKQFDNMFEGWTPDPQVFTTHKLSSNSSGVGSESNATGESAKTRASKPAGSIKPRRPAVPAGKPTAADARAKTSAFNAADGMEPRRPAMATSKPAAADARAKTSASKPPAAKTSASKPSGPSLPQEVQAGATDTPAKTAEPARVVQTVHSGAPVDARICDRELPSKRRRKQFQLSDYGS
jgi:hypothetical protein